MANYLQIYYHIVFSTKRRERVLTPDHRDDLYAYIWGILKKKKCHLYRIGGVEDHLHIFTSLHPTIALSNLIKDIKVASNDRIKQEGWFPGFTRWQDNYAAFTLASDGKDQLIDYIKRQEEHHRDKSFREELVELLNRHRIDYDPKYLE